MHVIISLDMSLEQQNSFFHCFSANGAAFNLIAAHLTRAVPTEEYHILNAVEAYWAHGLKHF